MVSASHKLRDLVLSKKMYKLSSAEGVFQTPLNKFNAELAIVFDPNEKAFILLVLIQKEGQKSQKLCVRLTYGENFTLTGGQSLEWGENNGYLRQGDSRFSMLDVYYLIKLGCYENEQAYQFSLPMQNHRLWMDKQGKKEYPGGLVGSKIQSGKEPDVEAECLSGGSKYGHGLRHLQATEEELI